MGISIRQRLNSIRSSMDEEDKVKVVVTVDQQISVSVEVSLEAITRMAVALYKEYKGGNKESEREGDGEGNQTTTQVLS